MTEEKHMSPEYEAAKQVVDAAIILSTSKHIGQGAAAGMGPALPTKIRELKAAADRYPELGKGPCNGARGRKRAEYRRFRSAVKAPRR